MQDPKKIEMAELDVARLMEVSRRNGLSSWELLRILLLACQTLYIRADVEYWMNQE